MDPLTLANSLPCPTPYKGGITGGNSESGTSKVDQMNDKKYKDLSSSVATANGVIWRPTKMRGDCLERDYQAHEESQTEHVTTKTLDDLQVQRRQADQGSGAGILMETGTCQRESTAIQRLSLCKQQRKSINLHPEVHHNQQQEVLQI